MAGMTPVREPELPDVARSIAIIMDRNGRWARRRRLPVAAGRRAGTRALRRTVEAAIDLGVESLRVYAFSTENWSRPSDEVDALMEIFVETIERDSPTWRARASVRGFIGRRDRATPELRAKIERLEEGTAGCDRLQLWIAFDYGGRAGVVEAARRLVEEGVDPRDIDENAIAARLFAPEMPDPTCSSVPPASCASPISSSGGSPTWSWSSSRPSGPTSGSASSGRRSLSSESPSAPRRS